MARTLQLTLFLLALVLPADARAQRTYLWTGPALPRTGAHVLSVSYGVQRSPDGRSVVEQPLVLSRQFDAASQALYAAFAQGTPVEDTSLRFRLAAIDGPTGIVNLPSVQHQSLAITVQYRGGQDPYWQVLEQFNLRSTGLTPSTSTLAPSTVTYSPTTFLSLQVTAPELAKLFPSNRDSHVAAVSFGLERPATASGAPGAGIRALPLVISRLAFLATGSENALLMEAVRTQRTFPLLTLKLAPPPGAGPTAVSPEWRFHDVGVTSSRTVASRDSEAPLEQVSLSYKRLEFVGAGGAVTVFNLLN